MNAPARVCVCVCLEYLHFHEMILLFTGVNAGPLVKNEEVKELETHTQIPSFSKKEGRQKKKEAFERQLTLQQVSYIRRTWFRNICRRRFCFKLRF